MEVTDVPLMVDLKWFHFLLDLKMSLYTNAEEAEIDVAIRARGGVMETWQNGSKYCS